MLYVFLPEGKLIRKVSSTATKHIGENRPPSTMAEQFSLLGKSLLRAGD